MGIFFSAEIPNKVWGLALLVTLLTGIISCDGGGSEDPDKDKCFDDPKLAWAKGERYDLEGNRTNYLEVPPYEENTEGGKEIKWVYLRLENNIELIGAVKFRELRQSETPIGANPGDYVKLLIRIDTPGWRFVPDITNVKVGGYDTAPSPDISPELLDMHMGTAVQKTGNDWEYYEVVLSRFLYYAVNVEAQKEIPCVE